MSGSYPHLRLHLALGLVFGTVLATGAATGAWGSEGQPTGLPRPPGIRLSSEAAARDWAEQGGDPWAAFYTPQQYATMTEALDGRYTGVGLWVARSSAGVVTVSKVPAGGPADLAGVRVGERLLAVDGRAVDGLPVTETVALLRGAPQDAGSTVVLRLRRGSAVRQVELRRELLDTDDVVVDRPAAGITRIAVSAFTVGTGDRVEEAVRARGTAAGGRGILLDLRGNSGGLVDESVRAASGFLDGGPLGSYRADGATHWLTAARGGDTSTPVVVLVDGGTMSAAELLTGALQDRDRAVVIGSRTFGKGAVQQPSPVRGGGTLEQTVGHYRTPAGRDLDGVGITPDVAVPPSAGPQAAERTAITVLDDLAASDPQ
ncbi:S41 family peptidase [Streptacidiphilus carbonis]|uniref:S41 family peptidase n=1 Tax=Streptacidiphilus carbonis TaxID=105422 RepID=UPI0005A6FB04|nr:S41 family peptidase [Streptacidiphilus carbonis]